MKRHELNHRSGNVRRQNLLHKESKTFSGTVVYSFTVFQFNKIEAQLAKKEKCIELQSQISQSSHGGWGR